MKVEEHGKKAVFLNPKRLVVTTVRIDGCEVKNSIACDFLVRRKDDDVLVELKGKDVPHALEQIEATFSYLEEHDALAVRRAALVVCSHPPKHPSFVTKLQKAKLRLSKLYRAPLHVVTGSHEYTIERLMSHTGPY